MENKKPWFSKTMWLNLVCGLLAAVAGFYPHANDFSAWITANMPMIGMGWGVLGMGLRLISKDKISLVD